MGNEDDTDLQIELEETKSQKSHSNISKEEIVAIKKLKKSKRVPVQDKKTSYFGFKIGGAFALLLIAVFGYAASTF